MSTRRLKELYSEYHQKAAKKYVEELRLKGLEDLRIEIQLDAQHKDDVISMWVWAVVSGIVGLGLGFGLGLLLVGIF